MIYVLRITRDESIVAEFEVSADRAIDLLAASVALAPAAPQPKPKPERKPAKKKTGNAKWSKLGDEAPRKGLLTAEKKQQIENLLIEGISVAEIETQMKVSKPTIYVIKTRLKNEGRI